MKFVALLLKGSNLLYTFYVWIKIELNIIIDNNLQRKLVELYFGGVSAPSTQLAI